jgi:hypothetical protein
LAVEAQRSEPGGIHFRGASNLPAGSQIYVQVSDFFHGAWKDYSEGQCVDLDDSGFFEGDVRPKEGLSFRNNLLLRVDFGTQLCKQPAQTLQVLGTHGEGLANVMDSRVPRDELSGRSRNPQLFQWSGWYYGLEAIARVLTGGQ